MRFLVLLLFVPSVLAQTPDGEPALLDRIERAVWASADDLLTDVDDLVRVDETEPLSEQLRRIRQRGYAFGVDAAQTMVMLDVLAAMRQERGDEIPRCADEADLGGHLDLLVVVGDDIVEMDPSRFSEEELFDPDTILDRLDERLLEPMRALVAARVDAAQPVCEAAPTSHHHGPDRTP